jgi:hypothetical protein
MVGFKSNGISSSDFNARAKALSERLGPVSKPERAPPQPRQRFADRRKAEPETSEAPAPQDKAADDAAES